MGFGWMSWLGIVLAALGWFALIGGDWALGQARLWLDPVYVASIGQALILTAIGLGIIDALNRGFGALNRFFEAVQQRSAARAQPAAEPAASAPTQAASSARSARPQPAPAPRQSAPAPPAPEIVERGRLGERAYLLFADGSMEVETLLGVRRFASMAEAQEFIGN